MRAALARMLPSGWVRNSSIALVAIFVVAVGGVVAAWFGSTLNIDQRIAAISAVLTAAALFVAVLASVVAIAAYRFTARAPALGVGFGSPANADGTRTIQPFVFNNGRASAPTARVMLHFLRVVVHSSPGWIRAESGETYIADAQTIHAGGLPTFVGAFNVTVDPAEPKACIIWTVVADQVNESGVHMINGKPGEPPPPLASLFEGLLAE